MQGRKNGVECGLKQDQIENTIARQRMRDPEFDSDLPEMDVGNEMPLQRVRGLELAENRKAKMQISWKSHGYTMPPVRGSPR